MLFNRIASSIILNFINFLSKIQTTIYYKTLFQSLEILKYINAFSFGIAKNYLKLKILNCNFIAIFYLYKSKEFYNG